MMEGTSIPEAPRRESRLEVAIAAACVIPVIREPDAGAARETALWCIDQGLGVIELTATTPGWERLLPEVRAAAPESALIGLGTVRGAEVAGHAISLGADFLVTPHPAADVRAAADRDSVELIEGGFTPGEVLAAADRGIAKLFPAATLGPGYLRSLLALDPAARVVPTGGLTLAGAAAWIDAGALGVGVGGDLSPSEEAATTLATIRAGDAGGAGE